MVYIRIIRFYPEEDGFYLFRSRILSLESKRSFLDLRLAHFGSKYKPRLHLDFCKAACFVAVYMGTKETELFEVLQMKLSWTILGSLPRGYRHSVVEFSVTGVQTQRSFQTNGSVGDTRWTQNSSPNSVQKSLQIKQSPGVCRTRLLTCPTRSKGRRLHDRMETTPVCRKKLSRAEAAPWRLQ